MTSSYRHPAPVRRLLSSLVPVVCPPDAVALDLTRAIVDHVELSMRSFDPVMRAGLLAGLAAYELGGLPFGGRPASHLPAARAARYFHLWWASPIGLVHELGKGVKGLLCLACYEQPAMWDRLGYTPQPWIDQVKKKRLAVHGPAIQRAAAAVLAPDPLPGVAAPRRRAMEVVR